MRLNMMKLLTGDINRMRAVPRFATYHMTETENVAEHTAIVGVYCVFILEWVRVYFYDTPGRDTEYKIDEARVLRRALIHDLEECRTGDLIRVFKTDNGALARHIHAVGTTQFMGMAEELIPDSDTVVGNLTREWVDARDKTPEGCIVDFADYLAAIAFLMRQRALGNTANATKAARQTLVEHNKLYDGAEFDFIRPLINDAQIEALRVLT